MRERDRKKPGNEPPKNEKEESFWSGAITRSLAEASVRRYHHMGIPTTDSKPGERYLEQFKTFISGYETSEYGVEWMRFEPGAPVPELVRTVPHIAFAVDDLQAEIEGKELLIPPNSPSSGVTVAFTVENGVPIEFLEFRSH